MVLNGLSAKTTLTKNLNQQRHGFSVQSRLGELDKTPNQSQLTFVGAERVQSLQGFGILIFQNLSLILLSRCLYYLRA